MYFQLEIDYSLMKLTKINIQLSVNSINKKQLKDRPLKIRLSRVLYLQRQRVILFFLDLKVLFSLDLFLLESVFFKCKLCLFGLIVASLRINQICIKIDKVKIKSHSTP